MPNLNTTNLEGAIQNLQSRGPLLDKKSGAHQPALDSAVASLVSIDNILATITLIQDGPRTDLDFTSLDNAIAAFKQAASISQTDTSNLAGLIQRNTPVPTPVV